MQKSWSIATSSGPSVGASTLLCGLRPVDRGIPGSPTGATAFHSCKPLLSRFGSAQQTASGTDTELQRTVDLDGATLPYGIAP